MIDEAEDVAVVGEDTSSVQDKTHVETGNAELNELMNGNMFVEKAISSNWKRTEFKDNLISKLGANIKRGSYFESQYTSSKDNSVQLNWRDREGNIEVGNVDLIAKGINMDVYPKAIHEFYNYSVETIYHIYEVAAGFIYDTYKRFLNLKSHIDEKKWKEYMEGKTNEWISSFGTDFILPYTDIKGTYSPDDDKPYVSEFDGHLPEFSQFLGRFRGFSRGESPYAKLNPDEYVNVVAALRKEITSTSSGYYEEGPLINLDIQNNPFDLVNMKSLDKYLGEDVSIQIVPYLINVLFDNNDTIKNAVPIVGYNVYIDFESVCNSILSAVKWNSGVNKSENRQEFVNNILNDPFMMKKKIHEKAANAISLFLFTNVHKVFNTFNKFLTLSEDYYDTLLKSDPEVANIISKVKYCLSDSTKLDFDKLVKDAIKSCIKEYNATIIKPENMLYIINDITNDTDNKAQLSKLLYVIYARAFSMINEDTLSINTWDDVISTSEYDKNESITHINGLDDYFIKDFFSNLFTTVEARTISLDNSKYSWLVSKEKSGLNGELIAKKYNRSIHHFYILLGMIINIYGNLALSLRDIDTSDDSKLSEIANRLKYKVNDLFKRILKDSISYLTSSYLNPVSTIISIGNYNNIIGDRYSSFMCNYIGSMISLCEKYFAFKTDKNRGMNEGIIDGIRFILRNSKDKMEFNTGRWNTQIITSYNTPEITDLFRPIIVRDGNRDSEPEYKSREPTMGTIKQLNTTIYENFVKSGLISLENS